MRQRKENDIIETSNYWVLTGPKRKSIMKRMNDSPFFDLKSEPKLGLIFEIYVKSKNLN